VARIVVGIAASHSPQLSTPAGLWRLHAERDRPVPMRPVMVNTYFPPNQPTAGRCCAFGRALRSAVESYGGDARVAVAGATEHLEVEVVDYVPTYRSPAGTGCGMAFARWC
jgi:3-O-methylgallate 3,4-dioxygenase